MQRVSIGHSVSVSKRPTRAKASFSRGARRNVAHQVLMRTPTGGRYTPGSMGDHARLHRHLRLDHRAADGLRAFVHVQEVAHAVAGAVAVVQMPSPRRLRARGPASAPACRAGSARATAVHAP